MKTVTDRKQAIKNSNTLMFVLKYIIGSFLLFCCAFILLKIPDSSAEGIKKGIDLCLNTLVPTLYPFMILTNYFVLSGLISVKIPLVSKIMKVLFKLPGECASVILFSMIGGLPIGAKMTQSLYEKGIISREQGQRMLYFCVNPGPAFVISTVGYYMLCSKEVGLLIFISLIASSLTVGILTRFIGDGAMNYRDEAKESSEQKSNILRSSVINSSKSLLEICSWVVAFSCISEMINHLKISAGASSFFQCIIEMTNGSKFACENLSVPAVAGVIGFSGICAHFQLMDSITKLKLKYKFFLVGRIISGSLAAVYCSFLLKLFPIVSETFSAGVKPTEKGISTSVITSLLMIIMSVLLIIGDDYSVKKKKRIKH